jgi:hypothetical protein
MSVLSQILSDGKELLRLTERVDQLLDDRKALLGTYEPRPLCLATMMELASRQRRLTRD